MLSILNKEACILLLYRLLAFRFVDKRCEISNLDLIRDIVEIIEIDNSMHFL
jgi:hypothetical protein